MTTTMRRQENNIRLMRVLAHSLKKIDLEKNLFGFWSFHSTEVRFASFLSGEFTTTYDSNKSTGKETGKTHLCGMVYF